MRQAALMVGAAGALLTGVLVGPATAHAQLPQAATVVTSPVIRSPAIPLWTGDTMFVRFSVRTDTIVRVSGGTNVVARSCGRSYFFIRVWRREHASTTSTTSTTRDSSLVFVDTVEIQSKLAATGAPSDTTVAGGETCLP